MRTIDQAIHPPKNYILRMWFFSAIFVVVCIVGILWTNRFKEDCRTQYSYYAIYGIELNGRPIVSFAGNNFFQKMRKMGFSGKAQLEYRDELKLKLEDLKFFNGKNRASKEISQVPIMWVFADGLSKEFKKMTGKTYGENFFYPELVAFSILDKNGGRIQLNPDDFTIFWAKDGSAVCAIPLYYLPEANKNGKRIDFDVLIEEHTSEGKWEVAAKIRVEMPNAFYLEKKEDLEDLEPDLKSDVVVKKDEEEKSKILSIAPKKMEVKYLHFPNEMRFYSAALNDRKSYGEMGIEIEVDPKDEIPINAWTLENYSLYRATKDYNLRAPNSNVQSFDYSLADAFHHNVRFLLNENFETREGGLLKVPVAKSLYFSEKEGKNMTWDLNVRLIRQHSFKPEELHTFDEVRVSRSLGTEHKYLRFAGETVGVRSFSDPNYYRLVANDIPALVFEIKFLNKDCDYFWMPFRIKTESGEELIPESIVVAEPGVYQYWFIPSQKASKLFVTYAITKVARVHTKIVPKIIKNN